MYQITIHFRSRLISTVALVLKLNTLKMFFTTHKLHSSPTFCTGRPFIYSVCLASNINNILDTVLYNDCVFARPSVFTLL